MNNVKIEPWKCRKCQISLGNIRTDDNGDTIYLDEVGGKVKCEIYLGNRGQMKRWCSRCNTINILRSIESVKLISTK